MKIIKSPFENGAIGWTDILRPKMAGDPVPPGFESAKEIGAKLKPPVARGWATQLLKRAVREGKVEVISLRVSKTGTGAVRALFYKPINHENKLHKEPRRNR